MTEQTLISIDPHGGKSKNGGRRSRRIVGWTIFLSASLFLLAAFAGLMALRRSELRNVADLEIKRNRLRVIADRLDKGASQAEHDKRVVWSVLGLCHSADDIPDLGGNRIVGIREGMEKLCMYVPAGAHTLEIISRSWPISDDQFFARAPTGEEESVQEKLWQVPLLPESGYWFVIEDDRRGGPVRWELTSNHPDFQPVAKTVHAARFARHGTSYPNSEIFHFPNQIGYLALRRSKTTERSSLGVDLMTGSLRGELREEPYAIAFELRIRSDGPASMSARDAQRTILRGNGDHLLRYCGDGKYEIRVSE